MSWEVGEGRRLWKSSQWTFEVKILCLPKIGHKKPINIQVVPNIVQTT